MPLCSALKREERKSHDGSSKHDRYSKLSANYVYGPPEKMDNFTNGFRSMTSRMLTALDSESLIECLACGEYVYFN